MISTITDNTGVLRNRHFVSTGDLLVALANLGILVQQLDIYMNVDDVTRIELIGIYRGSSETEEE